MGQTLNLEISDDIFAAIQQHAKALETSPSDLVADMLEKQYRSTLQSTKEIQKAKVRFESHFGQVDLGYPTGIDNQKIDEDLARAYADTHETS